MAKIDTRKLNKAFFKAFQSYVQNINEKNASMFHFCNYFLPVFILTHPNNYALDCWSCNYLFYYNYLFIIIHDLFPLGNMTHVLSFITENEKEEKNSITLSHWNRSSNKTFVFLFWNCFLFVSQQRFSGYIYK